MELLGWSCSTPTSKHQTRKIRFKPTICFLGFKVDLSPIWFKKKMSCLTGRQVEHIVPPLLAQAHSNPCPLSSICPSVVWLSHVNRPLVADCEGQVDVLLLRAHIFICYEVTDGRGSRQLLCKRPLFLTHRLPSSGCS